MAFTVKCLVATQHPKAARLPNRMSTNDPAGPTTANASPVEPNEVGTPSRVVYGGTSGGEVGSLEGQCTVDPLGAYEVITAKDHNTVTPVSDSHVERGLELGPDRVVRHGCETKSMLFGGQDIRDIIDGDRDEDRKAEPRSVFCPQFGQMMPTVESGDDA